MCKPIPREKLDEDLFLVLKTIFHYERFIASKYGLNFEEIYALQYLRRNPAARVTDLSVELKLPMFTISRLVDRLARNHFLSKEQDTSDKRNIHLRLEKAGEEVLQLIEASSYDRINANLSNMEEQKVTELLATAESLHVILGVTDSIFKIS